MIPALDILDCPYISQWAYQASNRGSDCGQTCVAMLSAWCGRYIPVNMFTYQTDVSGMSDADDLVNNLTLIAGLPASSKTLQPNTPTPPGAICLIEYDIFPVGTEEYHKQDDYAGLHWVVLLREAPGKHVIVHDPDYWDERTDEGAYKRYRWNDWMKEVSQPRTIVSLDQQPYAGDA